MIPNPGAPVSQIKSDSSSSLVRDAVLYSTGTYGSQILRIISGIVTKRLLGPQGVGTWAFLQIFMSYLTFSQCGTLDGAERELPAALGKGDISRYERVRSAMFSFGVVSSVILGAGLAAWTLYFGAHLDGPLRFGLLSIAVLIPIQQINAQYTILMRANKRFDIVSALLLSSTLINIVLAPTLIWFFHIYGMILAFASVLLASLLFWARSAWKLWRFVPTFALPWQTIKELMKIGVPITLSGVAFTVLRSVDSLLVGKLLGTAALGYYAVAVSFNGYVYALPNALSAVTYPRFQERYAMASGNRAALESLLRIPSRAMAYLVLPVLGGAAYLGTPFLIRHVLPKFLPAIPATEILLVGTYCFSLGAMPGQFLTTINKQIQGLIFTLISLGATAGAVLGALSWTHDLVSAGIATSLVSLAMFFVVNTYTSAHLVPVRSALGYSLELLVPLIVAGSCLLLLDRVLPAPRDILPDLGTTALKATLYLVAMTPLFRYAAKTTGIVARVCDLLRRRRAPAAERR